MSKNRDLFNAPTLLLTSFATWRPGQPSNASDDLLLIAQAQAQSHLKLHFLRQLPVNVPVASAMTIDRVRQLQPDILICCGMAESRRVLSLEARATVGDRSLYTRLDLSALSAGLSVTEISHDAGRFVCNGLYYAMLNDLPQRHPHLDCLFVHVPVLTAANRDVIAADFCQLLDRLCTRDRDVSKP